MNAGHGYILVLYVAGENRASESQLLMQRRRMERKLIEFTRESCITAQWKCRWMDGLIRTLSIE